MKTLLPASLRNNFYTSLIDTVEEEMNAFVEQKVATIKNIYSLSNSSKDDLFDIVQTIFLMDRSIIEGTYAFLTETYGEEEALSRLRDEIKKFPYALANRGTLNFYYSIFNTLGCLYDGYVILTKTTNHNRVSRPILNIKLNEHNTDSDITEFVKIPVDENYLGQEIVHRTLDEEGTLDEESLYSKLDVSTSSEELFYKKNIVVGFSLTKNYFKENYPLPNQYGIFWKHLIDLNKRATDVVIPSVFLSIEIQAGEKDSDLGDFCIVRTEKTTTYNGGKLHLRIYDDLSTSSINSFDEFYDALLDTDNINKYLSYNEDNSLKALTTLGMIEGGRYQISDIPYTSDSTANMRRFNVPSDKTHFITSDMVIKLYNSDSPESGFKIFKQNKYGVFYMSYNDTDNSALEAVTIKLVNNSYFVFEGENIGSYDRITFTSKKSNTRIRHIKLFEEGNSSELFWIYFHNGKSKSYIEIPKGLNLGVLTTRHF